MANWMVQPYRNEEKHGPPLGPFKSAEGAIRVGNGAFAAPIGDVTVYHHLCPEKAQLNFSEPIPEDKIAGHAERLERQGADCKV